MQWHAKLPKNLRIYQEIYLPIDLFGRLFGQKDPCFDINFCHVKDSLGQYIRVAGNRPEKPPLRLRHKVKAKIPEPLDVVIPSSQLRLTLCAQGMHYYKRGLLLNAN